MRFRQQGITSVEFAIVSTVFFMMLFGAIEFGRLMYSFAALSEGTRRAARLATVCPMNDPGITNAANFASLPNFGAGNLQVQYLDVNGSPTTTFGSVQYVRTSITGYSIPLSIPFINPTVTAPAFTVTLPRESLGVTRTTTYTCS